MNVRQALFSVCCLSLLLLLSPAIFSQEREVDFFAERHLPHISSPIPELTKLDPQRPRLAVPASPSGLSLFPAAPATILSEFSVLPQYARENPANFAPLCRMEVQVENQLPIGIWVNWEDSGQGALMESAHLRLRLLRF